MNHDEQQIQEAVNEQAGLCAVCCTPLSPTSDIILDINPENELRGVLCWPCGGALKAAGSTKPELLSALADYLLFRDTPEEEYVRATKVAR